MLDKTYDPKNFEEKIYAEWEAAGDFKPNMNKNKEAFAVVIPPPNVTGVLHMGHALDDTLQDILIRYNRMLGKNVLWQPGMDHAGIATQMVVERILPRKELPATISAVKSLSKPSGSGRKSPAAPFVSNCGVWALPATGRGHASPWTKASRGRCAKSLFAFIRTV